jgi:hypothetical protein
MSVLHWRMKRQIASFLVILLAAPLADASPAPEQEAVTAQSSQRTISSNNQLNDPDPGMQIPAADGSPAKKPQAAVPGAGTSESTEPVGQPVSSQADSAQQQNGAAQPLGTAAAPYERTLGVSASRPAGAVIAPAKQRRTRAFLIRMGVIVGACVAIGTVAALSHASPSQPH